MNTPLEQIRDEDDAARLRDEGRSWSFVAQQLGTTTNTARKYAAASDTRAHERAHKHQISLF